MAEVPTDLTQDVALIEAGGRATKLFLRKFNGLLRALREAKSGTYGVAPHVIIEDRKDQNTNGGAATSGSWFARVLTTLVRNLGDLASLDLDTHRFTLPKGTYDIEWSAPGYDCNQFQSRLWNATDSTVVGIGTSQFSTNVLAQSVVGCSEGSAVVTITEPKAFEVQMKVASTTGTTGLGLACNFTTEVYTRVKITRLA